MPTRPPSPAADPAGACRFPARQHLQCPDCHIKYPPDKMRSIEGALYCQGCYNIRKRTMEDLTRKLGQVGRAQRDLFGKRVQFGIAAAALLAIGLAAVHWML